MTQRRTYSMSIWSKWESCHSLADIIGIKFQSKTRKKIGGSSLTVKTNGKACRIDLTLNKCSNTSREQNSTILKLHYNLVHHHL